MNLQISFQKLLDPFHLGKVIYDATRIYGQYFYIYEWYDGKTLNAGNIALLG